MSERPTPHDNDSAWTAPSGWGVPGQSAAAESAAAPQPGSAAPAAGSATHPFSAAEAHAPYQQANHAAEPGSAAAAQQPTSRASYGYGYVQQPGYGGPQQPEPPRQHATGYSGGGYAGFPPPPAPSAQAPKRPRVWLAVSTAAVLAAALASGGTAALLNQDEPAAGGITQTTQTSRPAAGAPNWSEVAANVRPAVLAIDVATGSGEAQGSGVLIDDAGHVVTNNHVVAGARKVQVTTADGQIVAAEIVGTDPTTDLAVIKLDSVPDGLKAATLGESSHLEVGEPVMAVGNPLGLDSTVTTGIISALDRPVSASDGRGAQPTITNAIQVDAAINPGNSGGPLFDSAGTVVGITSSIATMNQSSGSIGLGFAIPVDLVKNIAEQLIANGVAEHAFLGVTMTDEAATAGGVTRTGAKVEQVQSGTPAEEAGLRSGDVIVGIDGHDVASAESLTGFVRQYKSGDQIKLTVVRSGEELNLTATLTTRVESN